MNPLSSELPFHVHNWLIISTTSNIGVSIISLHNTPRLHTLKCVIIIFFIPRTYNDSNKLTLGYIHQNPKETQMSHCYCLMPQLFSK